MRYIDTGSRDPSHALGTWLAHISEDSGEISELRFQTGFFSAASLGHLVPAIKAFRSDDRLLHVLVGSNGGATTRSDLEILLELVGPPRSKLNVAVVSFTNGYFHPKTIHVRRVDDSEAAYVGSANMTLSGVASLHVEAGMTLDTRDGDTPQLLSEISGAVDWWFAAPRAGLYTIGDTDDLDDLERALIIDLTQPAATSGQGAVQPASGRQRAVLQPMAKVPGFSLSAGREISRRSTAPPRDPLTAVRAGESSIVDAEWSKPLTVSDAQRKPRGNQRGSVTLTRGNLEVSTQTYFRFDLFSGLDWVSEKTKTGEVREAVVIPMRVRIGDQDRGIQNIEVSYASNREQGQDNYTSLLHLGPLAGDFCRCRAKAGPVLPTENGATLDSEGCACRGGLGGDPPVASV